MIDPKLIRHDAKIVLDSLTKRKNDFKLDDYLSAEEAARKIQTEVENLRSTKNKLTKTIGSSKLDDKAKEKIVDEVHEINESLKDAEAKLEGLSVEVKNLSLLLPNILHESVPDGNDVGQSNRTTQATPPPARRVPLADCRLPSLQCCTRVNPASM